MNSVDLEMNLYTKRPLRFGEDGKFRILMVSDIHGGVGYDEMRTVRAMQALVDHAKPHLVLLGGDIAGPGTIHVSNESELRELLDGLVAPMEQAGIPWAHVYGNHDDNFGLPDAVEIRRMLEDGNAHFAQPAFSADNAAGTALLARHTYLKTEMNHVGTCE